MLTNEPGKYRRAEKWGTDKFEFKHDTAPHSLHSTFRLSSYAHAKYRSDRNSLPSPVGSYTCQLEQDLSNIVIVHITTSLLQVQDLLLQDVHHSSQNRGHEFLETHTRLYHNGLGHCQEYFTRLILSCLQLCALYIGPT